MDQNFKYNNRNTKKYQKYTMRRFCTIAFCGKGLSKHDMESNTKRKIHNKESFRMAIWGGGGRYAINKIRGK